MDENLRAALIATSSASAVIWTGALIVTQLADIRGPKSTSSEPNAPSWRFIQLPIRPPAETLRTYEEVLSLASLALLGIAIFAPIFALFASGPTLALVALAFFLFYSRATFRDIDFFLRAWRKPDLIRDDVPDKRRYQKIMNWYVVMEAFQLISIAVVAIYPCRSLVFWISAISLFVGYQAALGRYVVVRRPFDPNA